MAVTSSSVNYSGSMCGYDVQADLGGAPEFVARRARVEIRGHAAPHVATRQETPQHAAVERIRGLSPSARVEFREIDLADLAFVRRFGDALTAEGRALDIVVNNAGILPPLERRATQDGFELKFGINVLGHFALDAQLWPLLQKAVAPRIVWVSSLVHRHGKLDFDDIKVTGVERAK